MEHSFYFESKFRTRNNVNYLKFQVPDGTEFVLSEEWMVSTQRKRNTPIQRLIFLKRNNYDNVYRITVEVSSSTNNASGKRVFTRKTKPMRTSIIILLEDFQHFRYPTQETVTYEDVTIFQRIIHDIFKYKVTIISLDASQKETENTPELDKILIMPYQLQCMLETGDFFDIIITGNCEIHGVCEIKAHRNILVARSSYFSSIFANQCAESIHNRIVVNETDMILVKEILHFIYTGVIRPMKFSVLCDLYMVANMFLLYDLKRLLSNELQKHLDIENSVGIFMLAYYTRDVDLENSSLQFTRRNFDGVKHTEIWISLLRNQDYRRILDYDIIMGRILTFEI